MLHPIIGDIAELGRAVTYLIVFTGMFIEGETFLVLAGILVHEGVIDYFDTIAIAFIAVIVHDIGYWAIGTRLGKTKRKKFLFVNIEKMERFFARIKKREGLYIFMSKFAWGMNRFALLSSGYFKTPLKKLLSYSVPAAFVWTTTFVSVGFLFAERAGMLRRDVKRFALFAALFVGAMIAVEYFIGKAVKKDADLPENVEEGINE